jgi:rare lipoprotein A
MNLWRVTATCAVLGLVYAAAPAAADNDLLKDENAKAEAQRLDKLPPVTRKTNKVVIDHSGRKEQGKASFYGHEFAGKKMANGKPFDPKSHAAASKSLPLGTTAKITNQENGKSTKVKVEDRGPYVPDRVVDVSPKAADELGLKKQGTAPVVVKPIEVPQPDGSVKPGAGAAESEDQAEAPR